MSSDADHTDKGLTVTSTNAGNDHQNDQPNEYATAAVTLDNNPPMEHRPWRLTCYGCSYVVSGVASQEAAIVLAQVHLTAEHHVPQEALEYNIAVPGDRRVFSREPTVSEQILQASKSIREQYEPQEHGDVPDTAVPATFGGGVPEVMPEEREFVDDQSSRERPDTPEEIEERRQITEAMMPLQLQAMAAHDDQDEQVVQPAEDHREGTGTAHVGFDQEQP